MAYERLNKKSKDILYAADITHIEDGLVSLEQSKVDTVPGKQLSSSDYTKAEKDKLAAIEENANYYEHPSSHPASIITETTSKRFVSDSEKATWNNKVDADFVRSEISKIQVGGGQNGNIDLSGYVTTLNFNTELAKKVDKEIGKGLSSNDYTTTEKNKLRNIAENANNYIHPSSHPASIIEETSEKRFVSDTEKATWNAKATESFVTEAIANAKLNSGQGGSVDLSGYVTTTALNTVLNEKVDKVSGKSLSTNDYTNAEKTKLAGIEANANNYSHPSSHPASIITETSEKRFVTDNEKATWNNKVDKISGKGLSTNDYTTEEKNKLQGIAVNANNYTHPDKHPASIITESTTQQFVTAVQKTEWSNKLNSAYPSSAQQTVANAIGGFNVGDSLTGMTIIQIIEKMLCNTSSSGGEDTPTPEIIYGRIPIAEVGGHIIPYSSITEDMIKNCSQLVHGEVKTMGRTSLGDPDDTAEGDYCIVLVPKESGYTVTKDNGIGGKVSFNTNHAGANGDVELTVNNVIYKVYGEILLAQGRMYIYVD